MAHYMAWFEADPAAGKYGWHWTMNHFHPPERKDGHPEIASHFHPLLGPYDSNDPDLLECHVLLMKYAGIDGVITDWYGTDNLYDYAQIHRNIQRLTEYLKRAGLRFAVCYEDQTVPNLVKNHLSEPGHEVEHGHKLLAWLQANWFTLPNYLKLGDQPLLLNFGTPTYTDAQWSALLASLTPHPAFFTEEFKRGDAIGGFGWPEPNGGTAKSEQALNEFYSRSAGWAQRIPAAYPRFEDIYQEAGVGKSWGTIEDREGKTYEETLSRALESGAAIVQLATWNDWGEGTQIEPSEEMGYRDLEATQRLRKKYVASTVPWTASDLRLPVELYRLRKKYHGQPEFNSRLEAISKLLFAGQPARAGAALAHLAQ
jgi:hypothetical protein